MIRNFSQAGPSTSDMQPQQEPPANVASKVAEVFLTAGHAFQRLGDLTLQLHNNTDDQEESKWAETDVEQLREALTKFAHELDTISERVQSRTMQIIKTDIKRRVMMPSDAPSRQPISMGGGGGGLGSVAGIKRAAPGGSMQPTSALQPKRLMPPAFTAIPRGMSSVNSGTFSSGPRLTSAGSAYAPTRLNPLQPSSSSSSTVYAHQQPQQQQRQPINNDQQQYYTTSTSYSPN